MTIHYRHVGSPFINAKQLINKCSKVGFAGKEFRRKKGDERGGKEFHSQTQSLAKDD